jgi:hypothetical protein
MARYIHPIGTLKPSWRAHYARFGECYGVPMPAAGLRRTPARLSPFASAARGVRTVHNN